MVGVFERKAAVRATLFKLRDFEIYTPNFDELFTTDFFDITIKNTPRDLIVPSNVGKFAAIRFCFFVDF